MSDTDLFLKPRRSRWVWVLACIAVLVLGGCPLSCFLYDAHWQHKLDARVAELTAQGQLISFQQMLDRGKDIPWQDNGALDYVEAFRMLDVEQGSAVAMAAAESPVGVECSALGPGSQPGGSCDHAASCGPARVRVLTSRR